VRLAVTGAAGFVGSAVCRAATAAGHEVHAFTRRDWDLRSGPLPGPPRVDAVVHAGALVTDWGPATPIWRTNVDGTAHVAASFPGTRLVFVSTASVYDPFTPTVDAHESQAPVTRYLTAYAASKAAAERLLSGRPDTVILRPHAVYGPGDPTLLPRILAAVRGNTLLVPGTGRSPHSLTSLDNLVAAVLLACVPTAPAGTYNVADAAPVALDDALSRLLAERGLPVRIRHLPLRPSWTIAGLLEATYRLARSSRPPRLTRYAISHLALERTLDLTAARERLGFHPTPTCFTGAASW
jgi:nucleoside-diphosphate-sugar epimerase